MKYKAVLFDMDGTILDTLGDLTDAVNYALRSFGMPERSMEEAAAILGNGARQLVFSAVPEGTADELAERVLSVYAPYYDSHCQIKTAPYPGILEMLRRLKAEGVKLAVISNKQDSAVKPLAERHFPGLLEIAVGESATVRRKPNPDAVLTALNSLGVDRSEAIYVGDTEVDIATARNAAMDVAAVTWGFRTRAQIAATGAEHIFDDAETLCEFLLSN